MVISTCLCPNDAAAFPYWPKLWTLLDTPRQDIALSLTSGLLALSAQAFPLIRHLSMFGDCVRLSYQSELVRDFRSPTLVYSITLKLFDVLFQKLTEGASFYVPTVDSTGI